MILTELYSDRLLFQKPQKREIDKVPPARRAIDH